MGRTVTAPIMASPPPTEINIPSILTHTWKTSTTLHPTSTISYNLSLGASGSALQHVYEGHPAFQPLPTYAATFAIAAMGLVHQSMPTFLPAFQPHNHVHASHWLRLHRPYPLSGTLTHTARVVDVSAVRNGVSLAVEITSSTEANEVVVTQQWTSIVLRVPTDRMVPAPSLPALAVKPSFEFMSPPTDRPPTRIREHRTTAEQAALYRAASGDLNPLHIDPETARKAGFEKPLLTGTCTIGVGVRVVMEEFGARDGRGEVKEVRCRLRRPVFAGEMVKVEMWEGDGVLVVWRMVVGEGKGMKVVVDGAGCLFGREEEVAKL